MIIPGQTPLESLNLGLTPEIRRLLQSLWIESIEELGALANAPKMKPSDAQGKTYTNTLASCACAALNQLPEMVRERVAVPAPMGAFGCLFAPELVETYRGRIMPVGELRAADSSLDLPARVDLKGQMHAVRDQGERGTCVAFATVALREFLDRAGMHLSEQFLYFKCKELDGAPVSGTFLRTALSVLHGYGVCRAITWPYVPRHIPGNEGQGPPPAGVDEEANLYIMPYGRSVQPSHVPQYKRILAGYREIPGMPVVVGTLMFASWAQSAEGQRTGKMTLPLPGEEPVGGHAWCIVGYQDASFVPGGGYFIARNSWGGVWAPASPEAPGHAMIPYAYIEKCAMEAFSGQSMEPIQVNMPSVHKREDALSEPSMLNRGESVFCRGVARNIEIYAAGLAQEVTARDNLTVLRRASFDDKELLTDEGISLGYDIMTPANYPTNRENWTVLGAGLIKKKPALCVIAKSFCGSLALQNQSGATDLVRRHIEAYLDKIAKRKCASAIAARGVPAVTVIFAPGVQAIILEQVCLTKNDTACYFVNESNPCGTGFRLGSISGTHGLYVWLALLPMTIEKRKQGFKDALESMDALNNPGSAMTLEEIAGEMCLPLTVIVYLAKHLTGADGYRVGPEKGPAEFIQRL